MTRSVCVMNPTALNEKLINRILSVVNALRLYHQHEVKGIESIPEQGKTLLVVNHSLATYDITLLFAAILQAKSRLPRPMADHLFFKIPYLGELVSSMGGIDGTCDNATKLLRAGELVCVAPGGMREALRPSSQRYQILWEKRKGFARIAMETQTPIVIGVCPKADDLYDVYPNRLTVWAYQKFRLPFFVARGVGLSPIPRPIKLVHFLSEPIVPPKPAEDPQAFDDQLQHFHQKIIKRTQDLIGQAIAHRS